MSQQQKRLADSLLSVIQTIQTGHWTGELRAQRDDALSTEVGFILFVDGQIVAAQVGPQEGMPAFNLMKTWGKCWFTFTLNTPPPVSQQYSSTPESPARTSETPPQITGPQRPITELQRSMPPSLPGAGLPLTTIPRATMSIIKARGIIEQAGLSRTYRQLSLLIDGHRSVADLTIAIGCTPLEMQEMLQQLERLSVIRLPR